MSVGLAIRFALLCCALTLVAVGCGGSGGQLSRTDFISQADAICRDLTTQEHSNPGTDPISAFDKNLGYLHDALGKLDKLNPPNLEKAKFADMMKHLHSSVAFLETNKKFLVLLTLHFQQHPADTKARDKFQQFIKPFDRETAAAKADAQALILNACVAGLSAPGA